MIIFLAHCGGIGVCWTNAQVLVVRFVVGFGAELHTNSCRPSRMGNAKRKLSVTA
jgi:hypothetical protein